MHISYAYYYKENRTTRNEALSQALYHLPSYLRVRSCEEGEVLKKVENVSKFSVYESHMLLPIWVESISVDSSYLLANLHTNQKALAI